MISRFLELLKWERIRNKPWLKHLTGFPNQTDSSISVDGSGVFTIAPASTSYVFYSGGKKFTKTAAATVNITNDLTLHYVYFTTAGVLTVSTSAWDITADTVPVALVYKDGTTYVVTNERHHSDRDKRYHNWAHTTIGARYRSGFGGTFGNTTFSIAQGIMADEDLQADSGGTKTACRLWYRNVGATAMRVEDNISTPWKSNAGAPQYDNAGTLTNVTVNRYFCSYVFATPDTSYPIYIVVGQNQHATIAAARSEATPTILLGTAEWKVLYRVIYQESGGSAVYQEVADYRNVSSGPAGTYTPTDHNSLINRDAASAHPTTAISFTDTQRVLGRNTAGTGAGEEVTLSQLLDWIGSAARGDLLYRGASAWERLAKGSAGDVLTQGADDPSWSAPAAGGLRRGYIDGLITSNHTDADHDISISAGECKDSTDTYGMVLSSAMVKQIDASWAAGSAAGGLFSGTVGNATWYHVFLIRKDSDGSIDAGFDTSVTAANKPAGYTYYRRIGSVLTNGSANILAFAQTGDMFLWKTSKEDVFGGTTGTSSSLATISTPLGVVVIPCLGFTAAKSGATPTALVSSPDTDDNAVSRFNYTMFAPVASNVGQSATAGNSHLRTNTSSQVRVRASEASVAYYIQTWGWIDQRGKDA